MRDLIFRLERGDLPRWFTVIFFQALLRTRLSVLGIDAHLGDDMEEIRQVAREIMAQLRSSPPATPTLSHLMVVLEQTTHELRTASTSTEKRLS